nr:AlNc14C429G11575 [Albugo laibachii Nc14]|eukprot:CCA26906.1 AlNc14C429G11575 [Albugo laibachii Nc14]
MFSRRAVRSKEFNRPKGPLWSTDVSYWILSGALPNTMGDLPLSLEVMEKLGCSPSQLIEYPREASPFDQVRLARRDMRSGVQQLRGGVQR